MVSFYLYWYIGAQEGFGMPLHNVSMRNATVHAKCNVARSVATYCTIEYSTPSLKQASSSPQIPSGKDFVLVWMRMVDHVRVRVRVKCLSLDGSLTLTRVLLS